MGDWHSVNSFFTVIVQSVVLGVFLVLCPAKQLMVFIVFLLRTERGAGNQMAWLWLPSKLLVVGVM